MITVQTFSVDEVDYEVKLVGGTSIVFKATIENPDADGTWWDDDLTYSTIDIVGGTKRPLKVYGKLAECVRTIIHGNKLKYCHFSVNDERRARIYERFAKTVKGYTYDRVDNLFYLFRQH